MGVKILCTLGPASLSEKVIKRLTALDVSLFRLNLSHVKLEEVERLVQFIRSCSDTPICLDTEGAQIRTGTLKGGKLSVQSNEFITVPAGESYSSTDIGFRFYPDSVIDDLQVRCT